MISNACKFVIHDVCKKYSNKFALFVERSKNIIRSSKKPVLQHDAAKKIWFSRWPKKYDVNGKFLSFDGIGHAWKGLKRHLRLKAAKSHYQSFNFETSRRQKIFKSAHGKLSNWSFVSLIKWPKPSTFFMKNQGILWWKLKINWYKT